MSTRDALKVRHRGRGAVVLVAAIIGCLGIALPAASASASGGTSSDQSTAVVTPLLNLFEFGDTVGLPEGCQTALTTVSAVVAEADATKQFSPIAAQIFGQCESISAKGSGLIQEGVTASGSGSAINPLIDPIIQEGSSDLATVGNTPGIATSPFSSTIEGLSQTFAYFEGS